MPESEDEGKEKSARGGGHGPEHGGVEEVEPSKPRVKEEDPEVVEDDTGALELGVHDALAFELNLRVLGASGDAECGLGGLVEP